MKNMALGAELELEGRNLTNHSVRKTLVMKLNASNHPRSAIIDVAGHTNEPLLAEYEEGVKAEQRRPLPLTDPLSANTFKIPVQFFLVCPFQRLQPAKQ